MKIKGSAGVSLKKTGFFAVTAFVLLTVVRIYQSFALTDGATGYFSENNISVPVMYALAFLPLVVILVMCFVSGDFKGRQINRKASLPAGITGIILALAIAAEGFAGLNTLKGLAGADPEYIKEVIGGTAGIAGIVFAFLASLVLVIQSIFCIKGKPLPSFMKLPMLCPVLWAFTNTLGFFSITVSYVKVVQLMLTIFTSVFFMLFIFENARISSDIGKKDALWFFYATGIITVGLGIASCVPVVLIKLFAPELECIYAPFSFTVLACVLYTAGQLFYISGEKLPEEEACEENGEDTAEYDAGEDTNNTLTETE